jgi:hypothetical protein
MLACSRLTAVSPGLPKGTFPDRQGGRQLRPISVTSPRALNPWSKNAPPATSRPRQARGTPRVMQASAAHDEFDADPAASGAGLALHCETEECERSADRCVIQVQPAPCRARDLRTRQIQGAGHRSALEGNPGREPPCQSSPHPRHNGQPSRQDGCQATPRRYRAAPAT